MQAKNALFSTQSLIQFIEMQEMGPSLKYLAW